MKETTAEQCAKCGATIFPDAPRGFCSVCLFKTGLGEFEHGNGEGLSATRIQTSFGDYELLEEIGRGGQGVVYRARQKSLSRTVALKVVGLGQWSSTPHLRRFRRDAEAAASLEHPQIVPIYEIGEREGSCYFSMKFVEGGQLDQVLKREPMSARRAAELLVKIARTVHFAHKHGILHRDIKPGNILLDRSGEPHLTDFGLARLIEQESTITNSFDVIGTPSYMAPEQAAGHTKEVNAAADVYSLGAVFYQMLTGEPPFAGGTTYETIRMVLETEPRNPRIRNPRVDIDLATICLKCLEKDPQRRYSTALDLAEDIERWLRHETVRARPTGPFTRGKKWLQRNPTKASLVVALAGLVAAVGTIIWKSELVHSLPPTTGIAVLPFENLSDDRENASFADGVQDDILTKLAKIADLKVISRSSVMQYREKRNIRQISEALRVSHVVEGTVRRSGGKVHINAQLVDARTNIGIWAEEYDRDLNNVFAIAAEAAQSIVHRLRVKVSAREKQAMNEWPTRDVVAYDLYIRAKDLFSRNTATNAGKEELLRAIDLLNQAVSRDPSFVGAFCQLAACHSSLYQQGYYHTRDRLALADAAVETAMRLRPDAGEPHLARAENLYRGYLDYDGALAELEIARRSLPNDSRVFELYGYILRRRGNYEEAGRSLERASELAPRNIALLLQIGASYHLLHRYAEAAAICDRALAIDPDDVTTRYFRATLEWDWKADSRPLHEMIESVRATNPAAVRDIADAWVLCALAERNPAWAEQGLIATGQNPPYGDNAVHFNHPFVEGVIARMTGDEAKAHAAFVAARAEQEKAVQAQPDYGPPVCVLAVIDAGLGRRDDALREARRAIELLPMEKDRTNGVLMIQYSAMTAAWLGDKDLALQQLSLALRYPNTLSYGQLKMPLWDPLRGDPRFEAIVRSLAPK